MQQYYGKYIKKNMLRWFLGRYKEQLKIGAEPENAEQRREIWGVDVTTAISW